MISYENIITLSTLTSILVQESFICRSPEDEHRIQNACRAGEENCSSFDNSIRGMMVKPSAICY